MIAFRRAKTTINPIKASSASSLVSSGIYRYTRNPMYLGMLITLLGWAAYLAKFAGGSEITWITWRSDMTLCPIALVAGCKKCPAFKVCPLKGVIGDYNPGADTVKPEDAASKGPAK